MHKLSVQKENAHDSDKIVITSNCSNPRIETCRQAMNQCSFPRQFVNTIRYEFSRVNRPCNESYMIDVFHKLRVPYMPANFVLHTLSNFAQRCKINFHLDLVNSTTRATDCACKIIYTLRQAANIITGEFLQVSDGLLFLPSCLPIKMRQMLFPTSNAHNVQDVQKIPIIPNEVSQSSSETNVPKEVSQPSMLTRDPVINHDTRSEVPTHENYDTHSEVQHPGNNCIAAHPEKSNEGFSSFNTVADMNIDENTSQHSLVEPRLSAVKTRLCEVVPFTRDKKPNELVNELKLENVTIDSAYISQLNTQIEHANTMESNINNKKHFVKNGRRSSYQVHNSYESRHNNNVSTENFNNFSPNTSNDSMPLFSRKNCSRMPLGYKTNEIRLEMKFVRNKPQSLLKLVKLEEGALLNSVYGWEDTTFVDRKIHAWVSEICLITQTVQSQKTVSRSSSTISNPSFVDDFYTNVPTSESYIPKLLKKYLFHSASLICNKIISITNFDSTTISRIIKEHKMMLHRCDSENHPKPCQSCSDRARILLMKRAPIFRKDSKIKCNAEQRRHYRKVRYIHKKLQTSGYPFSATIITNFLQSFKYSVINKMESLYRKLNWLRCKLMQHKLSFLIFEDNPLLYTPEFDCKPNILIPSQRLKYDQTIPLNLRLQISFIERMLIRHVLPIVELCQSSFNRPWHEMSNRLIQILNPLFADKPSPSIPENHPVNPKDRNTLNKECILDNNEGPPNDAPHNANRIILLEHDSKLNFLRLLKELDHVTLNAESLNLYNDKIKGIITPLLQPILSIFPPKYIPRESLATSYMKSFTTFNNVIPHDCITEDKPHIDLAITVAGLLKFRRKINYSQAKILKGNQFTETREKRYLLDMCHHLNYLNCPPTNLDMLNTISIADSFRREHVRYGTIPPNNILHNNSLLFESSIRKILAGLVANSSKYNNAAPFETKTRNESQKTVNEFRTNDSKARYSTHDHRSFGLHDIAKSLIHMCNKLDICLVKTDKSNRVIAIDRTLFLKSCKKNMINKTYLPKKYLRNY